jgi:hypothetical protein
MGNAAGTAILNVLTDKFFTDRGITDPTAVNLLKNLAVTLAGAAAGSTAGAAAAFNADANNRQLHPIEIDIIRRKAADFARQLKGGAAVTQVEIDAAEARLAQEANRITQFAVTSAKDVAAFNFLRQPAFQIELPLDPRQLEMGKAFAFYATPEQRANPNMYADLVIGDPSALSFYWKNRIEQPTVAAAAEAITRYQKGIDSATFWTKAATFFSAGVAVVPLAPSAITACLANITICGIQASELGAGSALGPNGMGVGFMAARAGFKFSRPAGDVNSEWIAAKAGNTAAWNPGTVVFEGEIAAGTAMRMYVDKSQFDKITSGDIAGGLGGWGTFDAPAKSIFQMRNNMALPESFKQTSNSPFYLVELEVVKAMPARVGFAGSQAGNGTGGGTHSVEPSKYIGGGTQIQLPSWDTRAQYLRIRLPIKCVGGGC